MSDLPAAHSMDTAWFAVDEDGHVARFDTGESGAMPAMAAHRGGPSNPNFDVRAFMVALAERSAAPTEKLDEDGYSERLPGVFDFRRDHGDDPGRYFAVHAPEQPVRVSELPASTREALSRFSLPVRFSEVEVVHLADHIEDREAVFWGDWSLRWPSEEESAYLEEQERARRIFAAQRRLEEIRRAWMMLLLLAGLVLVCGLAWWWLS